MSENSVESVSSLVEKRKQQKLLNEQNLSNEIELRLTAAFNDLRTGLVNIIAQLENLPKTLSLHLTEQAEAMATTHIEAANQRLDKSAVSLEQAKTLLTNTTEQLSQLQQAVLSLTEQVTTVQTQSQAVIANYAEGLQQQAQASMNQSEKAYQTFYQDLSKRQANMRVKAIIVGLVTFFLAMIPTAAMVGMAYYSKHLMTDQRQQLAQVQQAVSAEEQNLATIMTKVQQTPLEARALSMITVLPNDQNPKQLLIIPKNQQAGGYGQNPKGQKVLLVAPEMPMKTPPSK